VRRIAGPGPIGSPQPHQRLARRGTGGAEEQGQDEADQQHGRDDDEDADHGVTPGHQVPRRDDGDGGVDPPRDQPVDGEGVEAAVGVGDPDLPREGRGDGRAGSGHQGHRLTPG
jgi:hypothetical protein